MAEKETGQRKYQLAFIGLALTLLLNFGGLVWGASALSSTVSQINATQQITVDQLDRLQSNQAQLTADLRVVREGTLLELSNRIERLESHH